MTGPEHYRIAESLINDLWDNGSPDGRAHDMKVLAEAQVHATLALAAATILPVAGDLPVADHDAWWAIAGSEPVSR